MSDEIEVQADLKRKLIVFRAVERVVQLVEGSVTKRALG